MASQITDGDFTVASAISDYRYSTPIPNVGIVYMVEQDFAVATGSFSPIAVGTVHPFLSNYYLQKETALQPTSIANVMRWTRVYCKVPASHVLPTTVSYTFTGYAGNTSSFTIAGVGTPIMGRFPKTLVVPAEITFDYFLLDGITYTTPLDVPVISEQKYYLAGGSVNTVAADIYSDGYLGYSQATATPQFEYDLTDNPASAYPTREYYEYMIANKIKIVAVASQADLWNGYGNIVRRQTTRIYPQ